MASSTSSMMMPVGLLLSLSLSLSLLIPSSLALARVICEDLPEDLCAFSVSSSAKRCVLESYQRNGQPTEYQCRTSEVDVYMSDWIETDQCVEECGVDRKMVGISSDDLLEPQFTAKLCSVGCYDNCPNIIDLYTDLAAGEGVFLPKLCEAQRMNPHRAMLVLSSGAASGPVANNDVSKLNGRAAHAPVAFAPVANNGFSKLNGRAAYAPVASAPISS